MKKITLLVLMLLVFVALTNAQNFTKTTPASNSAGTSIKRCGTAEAYASQMANDPVFRAQREETEKRVAAWIATHPYDVKATTSYTIPVVVHVLYNPNIPAEKISLAQVQSQITATNTAWAGTSPHSIHQFPSTLKANTGVLFCLASIDPNGNATNGVDYVKTTVSAGFNITGSSINCTGYPERCSSTGGADAWDVTKYFNVWVCAMSASSGLCGISVFPTASNSIYYGTTINYLYFGTMGTATAPYNLGGTLTHELGHCFDLYHTGVGGSSCTGTDYCADTPNQEYMNYGNLENGSLTEGGGMSSIDTATGVEIDGCTTTPPGVMFENFMDGTDDIDLACFTPDQVARIQAILAVDDSLLAHSVVTMACSPTGTCSAMYSMYADTTTVHHYFVVNMAIGAPPLTYLWSWGDGSVHDSIAYPSHTYSAAGTYDICLTISDAHGCTSTYCDSNVIQKSGNTTISVEVIPQVITGIKDYKGIQNLSLYPNPASGEITICIPGNATVDILNIEGQVVKTIAAVNYKTTIDISGFAKGMYYVKAINNNAVAVKKFIKQ